MAKTDNPAGKMITVEVVFALCESQSLQSVSLRLGATVADAIEQSGIRHRYPDVDIDRSPVGVWGQLVDRARRVSDGDRVEIYRELEIEPREARRQLALTGRTMSQSGD